MPLRYRLKFYETEAKLFKKETEKKLSDEYAKQIAFKLARHFKLTLLEVNFYGHNERGRCEYYPPCITLAHNPSIELVCHEIAHLFNQQKNHKYGHRKRLMGIISKLLKYCYKKEYI